MTRAPLLFTASVAIATSSASEATARAPVPWYARASCLTAAEILANARLDAAEGAIRELESSRDADDVACAVYLRVMQADLHLAVFGETERRLAARDRHLGRMYGFSRAHARYGERFADLEMDARMRRVRVLFERGDRLGAVGEARRAHRLLAARADGAASPTVDFVRGAMFSALGQAGTLARMLLGVAGISGDPREGYRSLRRVADGDSVYRFEGLHLARQFATDLEEPSPLGSPIELGERLVAAAPGNPQYAYDHTFTLLRRGEPEVGLRILAPHLRTIEEDGDAWAPTMQAKLHYLATRCALDAGRMTQARAHHDAMASLESNDFSRRLPGLTSALERAEGRD